MFISLVAVNLTISGDTITLRGLRSLTAYIMTLKIGCISYDFNTTNKKGFNKKPFYRNRF